MYNCVSLSPSPSLSPPQTLVGVSDKKVEDAEEEEEVVIEESAGVLNNEWMLVDDASGATTAISGATTTTANTGAIQIDHAALDSGAGSGGGNGGLMGVKDEESEK